MSAVDVDPHLTHQLEVSRTHRVRALIRLREGSTLDALAQLQGVRVREVASGPLAWRRWAAVEIDSEGLAALVASRAVDQVRMVPAGRDPLDRSHERIGLLRARGMRTDLYTGQGMLLGDMDSPVDVFHPDFFFGDGGWFDWIDVDRNGVFSEATDAIDLDRNGVATPSERASVLRAMPVDLARGGESEGIRQTRFDPRVDWIYLDVDGDHRRSYGAGDGYDDDDLAFGEPLFVPDDVDRDGTLDPEERLVRLGTSKFRAVLLDIDDGASMMFVREYVRGVDLASSPPVIEGAFRSYSETLHATGVLGIVAGGVPLPSRRWVGIAPDAELTNAGASGTSGEGRLMWTYMQSPDVALHEYVYWTRTALDGSDATSEVLDESAEAGIANICPAGNIGASGKHVTLSLTAGQDATRVFVIPAGLQAIDLAVHVRGDGSVSASLEDPGGNVYPIVGSSYTYAALAGGGDLFTVVYPTGRGTTVHEALFGAPAMTGSWSLHLAATGGAVTIHALTADEQGFSRATYFADATPDSTVAVPATSDRCLAVGSVPSHIGSEGEAYDLDGTVVGEVRPYSARGPRIDGSIRPHIVAPDNPWAALGEGDVFPSSPGIVIAPDGAYQVFGGTSGAGPHVAGVALLLAQQGLSGEAILDALMNNTASDAITGTVPNNDYGFGRLAADRALGAPTSGDPPSVTLVAMPAYPLPGQAVQLIVTVSDGASVRWDATYDGAFDGDYGDELERSFVESRLGEYRFKVRARADNGAIAEAAVLVTVTNNPPLPDAGPITRDGGPLDGSIDVPPPGGCGCRVGKSRGAGGFGVFAASMLLAIRIRRRRSS